jgi:hypothetical protein
MEDSEMKKVMQVATVAALGLLASACQTRTQFLAQMQPMAMQTAVDRGKFELNCPSAAATVLSQEIVQPQLTGAWAAAEGVERAEYTIGVSGCGERKTFVVLCPEGGDGCFAAGPGGFLKGEANQ